MRSAALSPKDSMMSVITSAEGCFTSQAFSVNCSGVMRPEAAPLAYVRRCGLQMQREQSSAYPMCASLLGIRRQYHVRA